MKAHNSVFFGLVGIFSQTQVRERCALPCVDEEKWAGLTGKTVGGRKAGQRTNHSTETRLRNPILYMSI